MKKLFIAMVFILMLVLPLFALVKKPTSYELSTSTWTAIISPESAPYGFAVWTSDESGFFYSRNSDGSNSQKVPKGSMSWPDKVIKGDIVFYAQAEVGTPTLTFQPAGKYNN